MDILSLFDGCSGWQQAISNLWIKDYFYFASEIDKFAIQVTRANFPKTIQIWNILDVSWYDFKVVDLLLWWSPCTNLSFAWKQKWLVTKENIKITKLEQYLELKEKGFEFEWQSYLFWEYMRILNEIKPKYFLLENVVMSKEWEKVFNEAIWFESVKINSSLLTAQSRKRLYWVWKLQEDWIYSKVEIDQPEDRWILLKDILEENVDEKYYLDNKYIERIKNRKATQKPLERILWDESKTPCLTARWAGEDHSGMILYKEPKIVATQIWQSKNFWNSWWNEKGYTIKTNTWHWVIDLENMKIRKLTPTECERLQWVKDWYTASVSNSQRYKMLGNWWTIPVIEHILKTVLLSNK